MSQLPNAPIVVDSPLPVTPTGAVPPVAAAEPILTPTTPSIPTELQQLGQTVGIDVSTIQDPSAAEAAIKAVASQYARAGFQQQQPASFAPPIVPQPQYPPQYSQPIVPQPSPFQFDETTDPKVVAAFQALQSENQRVLQEATAAREAVNNFQYSQLESQRQEVGRRASSTIDKLASPKYGVSGTRNVVQQAALTNLSILAGAIVNGMGSNVGTIEDVIRMAVLLDGGQSVVSAPVPPSNPLGAAQQAAQQAALVQRSATAASFPRVPVNAVGSAGGGGTLLGDAEYMAGARAILRR